MHFPETPSTNEGLSFDEAVKAWVAAVQDLFNKHYAYEYPNLPVPQLAYSLNEGRRYLRIVIYRNGNPEDRSVHSFIDRKTGDVLKAASWQTPAKNPRGNIYRGLLGVDKRGGIIYMK